MNHSVKRFRQTTLFESFVGAKRGKTLDLMETDDKIKTDLRNLLASAAEKRIFSHSTTKKAPEVLPESKKEPKVLPESKKEPKVPPEIIIDESSCSTVQTEDYCSLDDFPLTLSQNSDDLFPEDCCVSSSASANCDDIKAQRTSLSGLMCNTSLSNYGDGKEEKTSSWDKMCTSTSANSDDMKAERTLSWDQTSEEVQLNKLPECCPTLPPLKASTSHTVMFKLPIQNGVSPEPYPRDYRDVWDSFHVKMPCSPESKCPVLQNGEKVIESRWDLIEKSLLQDITSSYDLQEAILQYNSHYATQWDFRGLHAFFKNVLKPEETERFFHCTLPAMVRLALQLPQICTQPIPLLKQQSNHAITLTQKQIACLLSNAFFCTYPRRNHPRKRNQQPLNSEDVNYPDINFNRLFQGTANAILSRKAEKLRCLLNYFARVTSEEPTGTVTFQRQYVQNPPEWSSSERSIRKVVVDSYGVIEEGGHGMLQVDFANKFVGGGVLGLGSVQEEIRFVICPELIISRLFTERLGISDVLLISGAEQFNKYSGYADSFVWDGDFRDDTPRDSWGRRCTRIVAMDALSYRNPKVQYRVGFMERELNKAYSGFYECNIAPERMPAVATGNWGCGVYKGNPHLKFLIQLMAASEAGRDMLYFTFRNSTLEKEIKHMYSLISHSNVEVGDIWALLRDCSSVVSTASETKPPTFYNVFCSVLSTPKSPVTISSGTSSTCTKSYENSDDSTESFIDLKPTPQNEAG